MLPPNWLNVPRPFDPITSTTDANRPPGCTSTFVPVPVWLIVNDAMVTLVGVKSYVSARETASGLAKFTA